MYYRNRIVLSGILTKGFKCKTKYDANNVYEGKINVERDGGMKDSLLIRVYENLFEDGIIPCEEGDKIWLLGEFRTHMYVQDGTKRYRNYVYVMDLAKVHEEAIETNIVDLAGIIRKKGDLRYISSGRRVQEFTVESKTKNGNNAYIPVIFWDNKAEYVSQRYKEGDKIKLKGRYQSRKYTEVNPNGKFEKKITYEVSADTVEI